MTRTIGTPVVTSAPGAAIKSVRYPLVRAGCARPRVSLIPADDSTCVTYVVDDAEMMAGLYVGSRLVLAGRPNDDMDVEAVLAALSGLIGPVQTVRVATAEQTPYVPAERIWDEVG